MAGSPVPVSEVELVPWLGNFSSKFPNYAGTLGFSSSEIESARLESAYLAYLLNVLVPAERQSLAATVEYKNLMKDGDAASSLPLTLPGSNPPPPFTGGPLPAPGIVNRLRKLVQNIKSRPGYTDTIGQDLGIVTASGTASAEIPTLTVVTTPAGAVTIAWNKSGWTGIKVQSRNSNGTGGGVWQDLGVDLYSPFVDTRPLLVGNQPEVREYRACYLDGDTPQPAWSQSLTLTVTP